MSTVSFQSVDQSNDKVENQKLNPKFEVALSLDEPTTKGEGYQCPHSNEERETLINAMRSQEERGEKEGGESRGGRGDRGGRGGDRSFRGGRGGRGGFSRGGRGGFSRGGRGGFSRGGRGGIGGLLIKRQRRRICS